MYLLYDSKKRTKDNYKEIEGVGLFIRELLHY